MRSSASAPESYSTAMSLMLTATPPTVAESTSMGLLAVTRMYTVDPGPASVLVTPSSRSLQDSTSVVRGTAGGRRHPPAGSDAPESGSPGSQHNPASSQQSPEETQSCSQLHPEGAAPPQRPAHELVLSSPSEADGW